MAPPASQSPSPSPAPGASAAAPGPPAPGVLDDALRRLAGVLQARSCEPQHAELSACLAAAQKRAGGDAAAAAQECARYVEALHFCEGQLSTYGQQSNHFLM